MKATVDKAGRLVIPRSGIAIDDTVVRELIDAYRHKR